MSPDYLPRFYFQPSLNAPKTRLSRIYRPFSRLASQPPFQAFQSSWASRTILYEQQSPSARRSGNKFPSLLDYRRLLFGGRILPQPPSSYGNKFPRLRQTSCLVQSLLEEGGGRYPPDPLYTEPRSSAPRLVCTTPSECAVFLHHLPHLVPRFGRWCRWRVVCWSPLFQLLVPRSFHNGAQQTTCRPEAWPRGFAPASCGRQIGLWKEWRLMKSR